MSSPPPTAAPSPADAPVIRLDEVSKSFVLPGGAVHAAVRSVSLAVQRGDVCGLIGTSGAGKSTLLRLVNRLEQPDSGRVIFGGREITALGKRDLRDARQRIGMIFQGFNLLQNASVFDNVAFPLRLHGGRSAAAVRQRVDDCLALVGLADRAGSYPAQLSGGQKQRVAIARALAPEPEVLLCDEPTSALDAETTRSVLDTLRDINRRLGVTLLIVTHELAVVRALCRSVAVMELGVLVERFDVADIADAAEAADAAGAPRRSALGRELVELARLDALRAGLDRVEA